MGSPVQGLAEIVLWTTDMRRSLIFYEELLGLKVMSPPDLPVKFLRCGEGSQAIPQMLVLVPHPDPSSSFPAAKTERVLHHLAFNVDGSQYESLRQRFRDAGLELREGIHPVLQGVQTFYVDDPEGNEVEIISPTGPAANGG